MTEKLDAEPKPHLFLENLDNGEPAFYAGPLNDEGFEGLKNLFESELENLKQDLVTTHLKIHVKYLTDEEVEAIGEY